MHKQAAATRSETKEANYTAVKAGSAHTALVPQHQGTCTSTLLCTAVNLCTERGVLPPSIQLPEHKHTIIVHTNPGPSRSHRVYLGYHSGQLQHISAVDCVKVHRVEVLDTHLIAVTRGSCGKDGRGREKNRGSHITFISSLTWRVDCAAWWCDTLELHFQCILTHMSREGQACTEPHSLTEGVAHCAGHCNRPPDVALPHVSRHMCIRQKGIAAPAVQARVAGDVLCTGY